MSKHQTGCKIYRLPNYSRTDTSAGATLLEILIALLILSVGMLAISRMLTQSIVLLNNALQQQRAAIAINNLAEILQGIPEHVLRASPTAADYACTDTRLCNPREFFAHSLHRWTTRLASSLPTGKGNLEIITTNHQDMLRLSVTWRSSLNQAASRTLLIPITHIPDPDSTRPETALL